MAHVHSSQYVKSFEKAPHSPSRKSPAKMHYTSDAHFTYRVIHLQLRPVGTIPRRLTVQET